MESSGRGFYPTNGKPIVRLEGHILWKVLRELGLDPETLANQQTGQPYTYLNPSWDVRFNQVGDKEWDRYLKACSFLAAQLAGRPIPITPYGTLTAAEIPALATSWGMFQILGMNFKACGAADVAAFVSQMSADEKTQLDLWCQFIQTERKGKMVEALKERDWATFARLYNGPAYAKNRYDQKLDHAYNKLK